MNTKFYCQIFIYKKVFINRKYKYQHHNRLCLEQWWDSFSSKKKIELYYWDTKAMKMNSIGFNGIEYTKKQKEKCKNKEWWYLKLQHFGNWPVTSQSHSSPNLSLWKVEKDYESMIYICACSKTYYYFVYKIRIMMRIKRDSLLNNRKKILWKNKRK